MIYKVINKKELLDLIKPIVEWLSINDTPQKSDVIFGFGSIKLPSVWKQAANLYKNKFAPHILVSGGPSEYTKDPEARIIQKILLDYGIPEAAITIEEKATNTLENTVLGMKALGENNLPISKAILVSKPFHMRRCFATFRKKFPEIELFCCPPQGNIDELIDRPLPEFSKRLIGEINRLKIYADKGDIISQKIPDNIINAVEQLKLSLK